MKYLKMFKRGAGENWYTQFKCRGKRYMWCTKTSDKDLARQRARHYYDKVFAEEFELVDKMKYRRTVATFEELIGAYKALPAPSDKVRAINSAALLFIAEKGGLSGDDTLDKLDAELLSRFKTRYLAARKGESAAAVTCNAKLRYARSLFSKDALEQYPKDLIIPASTIEALRSVPRLKEVEKQIELPTKAALANAKRELPKEPELYRAYLLARYGGLRAAEIREARRDWLRSGNFLSVGGNADQFMTKSRKERLVRLPAGVVQLLKQSDDLLHLVGPNRVETVDRLLPARLKSLGFPESKPLHSVRRLFGSVVYTEQGPRQAKDALGHSTQAVTDKYYAKSLDKPVALKFVG